jgi:hypothetical protein
MSSTILKFKRVDPPRADAGKMKVVKSKKVRNLSRAMLLRAMKLGEKTMKKIRGTSLDSAEEMDELIMLNRGAEEGQLTPVVRKLVDDAFAGKDVSAIMAATMMGRSTRTVTLIAAWRKRMVSTWEMADEEERIKFIAFLGMKFDPVRRAALLDHLIEHIATTENVTILKTTEPES